MYFLQKNGCVPQSNNLKMTLLADHGIMVSLKYNNSCYDMKSLIIGPQEQHEQ